MSPFLLFPVACGAWAARFFGGDVEKVPHMALTVGVGTVMVCVDSMRRESERGQERERWGACG